MGLANTTHNDLIVGYDTANFTPVYSSKVFVLRLILNLKFNTLGVQDIPTNIKNCNSSTCLNCCDIYKSQKNQYLLLSKDKDKESDSLHHQQKSKKIRHEIMFGSNQYS